MRTYLLPNDKKAYKANLHCHSTISDGKMTPEELKALYKEKGYQILAYTDHEVLVPHPELNDEDFLAMTGYEAQIYGDMELPKKLRRVSHLNFYPRDQRECTMPFFNLDDVLRLDKCPDLSRAVYLGNGKDEKVYSAAGLNALIEKARAHGFIASYNHPTWSKEDASVYTGLRGLFAMEIYNHGAELSGHDCYCPYIYEEMLRSGQRLGCIATDDTHERADLFGGFTYVYADALTQEAVTDALERGDFYASRGPIIHTLFYEDGTFYIECSAAKEIRISSTGRRDAKLSVKRSASADITAADFPLSELDHSVRFTVIDKDGNTANTRGYLREEFEKSAAAAEFKVRKI